MAVQTESESKQQNAELVNKIELEVDRKVNLGNALMQHQRVILQDLPFNGQPGLLSDEHRVSIERLVEKNLRYEIKIKRIIGYASRVGDDVDNLLLSRQRAEEVHNHLLTAMYLNGFSVQDIFYPNFEIIAQGESDLPHPTNTELDNPLNRRVEIVYIWKYVFPVPVSNPQTSTLWKIEFGPVGSGGLGLPGGPNSFGGRRPPGGMTGVLQIGVGTLSMLPDADNGLSSPISKNFTFEQVGVSMGLFSKLKKLKFIKKFPLIRRFLHDLHPEKAGNYAKTQALLQSVGVSMDIINSSEGGEFETSLPLSFAEMQTFNFAIISASLSFLLKGDGAMLMLHSEHFFANTVIFGFGQNIAVPDFEVQFVPAGFVQVTLN